MNEHPWLQHDWPFVCRENSLLLDDAQCRRYGRVKSVDLHDDCVEVRHLRVDSVEIKLIDSIDFSKQSCQKCRILLQLYESPQNVRADTVVAT